MRGSNELITFTISGTEYQAEEGMTWEGWVNSSYNPGDYTIENNQVEHSESGHIVCRTSEAVDSTEVIVKDEAYVHKSTLDTEPANM